MPSSADEAEEEYTRLKMAQAKISEEGTAEASPTSIESELDSNISSEDAQALKVEGNALYKSADYKEAIEKYSSAATSAHATDDDRAVYLANRAAAYLKLQQFDNVVKDATEALKLRPSYFKALARRREANEALKHWRSAWEDAKELKESQAQIRRLQLLADEKDKKDTAEALNSLKGLGNSILSNFGMSIDDFATEKDPVTGSYNIKMKQ